MSDSLPPTTTSDSYFTGSDRVQDYFIDLEIEADCQPLDVQGYLECIAINLKQKEFPDDLEWDWHEIGWSEHGPIPYEPNLERVTEGLNTLRHVAETREHGLWIDPSDVAPSDLTPGKCGGIPWLAYLVRTNGLAQAASDICLYMDESEGDVVYGNVRIPFPNGLCGPQSGEWLRGTATIYAEDHPVSLADRQGPEEVVLGLRYALCSAGVRHGDEPVLPLHPASQELFDRDPEAYFEGLCITADRGEPRSAYPVGYLEWCDKSDYQKRALDEQEVARAERLAKQSPSPPNPLTTESASPSDTSAVGDWSLTDETEL